MAERKKRIRLDESPARSYFERDDGKTCSACGGSWADHSDQEWSTGCRQPAGMSSFNDSNKLTSVRISAM